MHYVCIENNTVISILNYNPAVPSTVTVVAINDSDYGLIEQQTHYFNATSKTVVPVAAEILAEKTSQQRNAEDMEFLRSTDWQVLRHIRQQALGVPTSLTTQAYLDLEEQRQAAASRIV